MLYDFEVSMATVFQSHLKNSPFSSYLECICLFENYVNFNPHNLSAEGMGVLSW